MSSAFRWHRHWTDHRTGVYRKARRTISNWSNFITPAGIWAPSAPNIAASQGAPPDWVGQYDFSHESSSAPLQAFFRDATDPGNRAMIGVRLSEHPGSWVNIKAKDIDNSSDVTMENFNTALWEDLWTNTDLRFYHNRHKLEKEIKLKSAGHPSSFSFTLLIPGSHTLTVANNQGEIKNASGDVMLRLRAPWARDSSGDEITGTEIDVTMTEGDPVGQFKTIILTPDADQMATAVYPVIIDPSTTIGGGAGDTDKIEDNTIISGANSHKNYGSFQQVYQDNNAVYKSLIRISDITQIPDGTITSFTMTTTSTTSNTGHTISLYAIKDANDWIEGNSAGAQESGASCWDWTVYNTVAWAGAAGCATSGTDYDADASPPTYLSVASATTVEVTLDNDWATDWRDSNRDSNGMVMVTNSSNTTAFRSTETSLGSGFPQFDIDYDEAAGGTPAFLMIGGGIIT